MPENTSGSAQKLPPGSEGFYIFLGGHGLSGGVSNSREGHLDAEQVAAGAGGGVVVAQQAERVLQEVVPWNPITPMLLQGGTLTPSRLP
jgi:hypothetical protein